MGNYTQLALENVDEQLAAQLTIAVDELTKCFGANCSILLSGGFGRGEGSVKFLDDKTVVPLHDFDIYVISESVVNEITFHVTKSRIRDRISRMLGFDLTALGFTVDVEVVSPQDLTKLPPDISAYELKVGSMLIHGPDLRHLISLERDDVAVASGAITLFHRAFALISHIEPRYLRDDPIHPIPEESRFACIYECCKVFTEICTSLSLLDGFYTPSYRDRAELFVTIYRQKYPKLWQQLPTLADKVSACTEAKLMSDFRTFKDWLGMWHDARNCLSLSLRVFMNRFVNLDEREGSELDYFKAVYEGLRTAFFREYLSHFLRLRGFHSQALLGATVPLSQIYDNLQYKMKVRSIEGRYPSRFSIEWGSPILRIFISGLFLLFALEEKGSVKEEYLNEAERLLAGVYPVDRKRNSGLEDRWSYLRDISIKAQKVYFSRKTGKIGTSSASRVVRR